MRQLDSNRLMIALQEVRDIAWQKAMRYRFDPVLGQAHEEYLKLLKVLIEVNYERS
jgi:hypothetical protein